MKDIDSIEISQILEEADEDMFDARRLGGRSAPAARYAASQSAEKYLRALCEAVGRPAGIMWDILKIHDTVGDIAGLGEIRILPSFFRSSRHRPAPATARPRQ